MEIKCKSKSVTPQHSDAAGQKKEDIPVEQTGIHQFGILSGKALHLGKKFIPSEVSSVIGTEFFRTENHRQSASRGNSPDPLQRIFHEYGPEERFFVQLRTERSEINEMESIIEKPEPQRIGMEKNKINLFSFIVCFLQSYC